MGIIISSPIAYGMMNAYYLKTYSVTTLIFPRLTLLYVLRLAQYNAYFSMFCGFWNWLDNEEAIKSSLLFDIIDQ